MKHKPLTCPHNMHVRVFELGREVEMESVVEEEPQPAKTVTRYRAKKEARITKLKGLKE